MYTLRRWWDRYRLRLVLTVAAFGSALVIRQTAGAAFVETYRVLTLPFQGQPSTDSILNNAQNQELQQRLTELEAQNQKLKELLGYVAQTKQLGVSAPVIGRSADHWWHQITLGRGSNDRIKLGDTVMAPGGIVGRVISVTPNTSRVLLLSDPSSRTGVTISRSRNMGYLRGQAANRAVMEFFDKVPDVRRGDVVSTSTLSQLYPAGLPLGRIESVNLNKSPAPEAIVELSAPIGFLEWTVVYPYQPPQPASTDQQL
jgi:rod shape-determining protein MreC